MPVIGGKYVNPFYQQVDGSVSSELSFRANAYGTRVRTPESGDPTKLFWSYGKVAWAQIFSEDGGNSVALGSQYSKLMSDEKGKLLLYEPIRNVPKYPLLQSLTISNEGTIGSLLKGTFDFTVYPNITAGGFSMEKIERAYFKPGKVILAKWGWSVRSNSKANRGQMQGIIYNFEWSVQPDLAISAKVSFVSKATIAIGLSGEQHNPDPDSDVKDPQDRPIPNSDLAGVLEQDVAGLGGDKNTQAQIDGPAIEYTGTKSMSKFSGNGFTYWLVAIPRSVRDMPDEKLTDAQKQQKQQDQKLQETREAQNTEIDAIANIYVQKNLEADNYRKSGQSQQAKLDPNNDVDKEIIKGAGEPDKNTGLYTLSAELLAKRVELYRDAELARKRTELEASDKKWTASDINNLFDAGGKKARGIREETFKNQSASTDATANPPAWSNVPPPKPIAEPTYFVKLGSIAKFMNGLLIKNGSPVGGIAEVKIDGNITQYLEDVVSTMPDKVFFPDAKMGAYGRFVPFSSNGFLGNPVNVGNILVSTTCVIETYREFLKDNQTNITYKNLTNFWDALIKKINFASGETYQLTTRLIDPGTLPGLQSNGTAILSVEDANIAKAVTDAVTPYMFTANIAAPIMKSVNISSKPPGPLAAAAYVDARGSGKKGGSQQIDVATGQGGSSDELTKTKTIIQSTKDALADVGASDKFHTDLKGAYASYKRAASNTSQAHWLNKALYPVNLSLTIDGINGFKFGDVIKTTLVPRTYNKEGLVFVITKINHTIQNGIWETTLETKSRLNAGS
jgi:hypothetical protein